MKNRIYIILLFLAGIISCGNPEGPGYNSNTGLNPGGSIDTTKTEAVIDTTDLYYLPEDTGGTHRAHPLGTTTARFGHYVYTPSGYSDDGPGYPLILFLHGWGERGDSSNDESVLDDVLKHGPPKLIRSGRWKPRYPFVVVSPQLNSTVWPPHQVHNFIEYVIENYQINENRIYLTGLSLGGGGCWQYVGSMNDHYAAAVVPISGSGHEDFVDNLRTVPIWAFHGGSDELVDPYENFGSVQMVQLINRTDPPVRAKVTVYPIVGHDAWTRTYNGKGMNHRYMYDNYNMNIYEWLLQYKME